MEVTQYYITTGKTGKLFTLRREGYKTYGYGRNEREYPADQHMMTLKSDLDESIEKALDKTGLDRDQIEMRATETKDFAEKTEIDHYLMPNGKFQDVDFRKVFNEEGERWDNMPEDDRPKSGAGYLMWWWDNYSNSKSYKKTWELITEYLKEKGYIIRVKGGDVNDYKNNVTQGYMTLYDLRKKLQDLKWELKKKRQRDKSEFVAEEGERIEFEADVLFTKVISGHYGNSQLIIFKDNNDNKFKWFSSGDWTQKGKRIKIRGTVKEHEEYNGEKQTVLTRCKILEEYDN